MIVMIYLDKCGFVFRPTVNVFTMKMMQLILGYKGFITKNLIQFNFNIMKLEYNDKSFTFHK